MDWGSLIGTGVSALGSLFGGNKNSGSGSVPLGGQAGNGYNVGSGSPAAMQQASSNSSGSSGGFGSILGGLGSLFGGSNNGSSGGGGLSSIFSQHPILTGLGEMFGAQAVKNPQLPELPDSFKQYQAQANAGGPPIQQQANAYNSMLLSGQNTDANDAATHSLDLNYQEQLRQLNGMYKSLRPGTDPTSDTTYQRDLNNLNDMYARQRAQTLAQQQQGAAQYGLQSGVAQSTQQLAGIETQVSQLAAQYGLDAQQAAALRNMLMQMGGTTASLGAIQQLFPNALGGKQ